jgi:hypothetical protein
MNVRPMMNIIPDDMQVTRSEQTFLGSLKSDFVTTTKVATDTDGLRWTGRLIQRIVDIMKLAFGTVAVAFVNLATHAGALATLVECVEPLKRGNQLLKSVNKDIPNWAEISSLGCTLVYRSLTLVKYMHEIGVPYLETFNATIGSWTVLSAISWVGNVFDLTQNVMAIERNALERRTAQAALSLSDVKRKIVLRNENENKVTYEAAANQLLNLKIQLQGQVGFKDPRIISINNLLGIEVGVSETSLRTETIKKTEAVFRNTMQNADSADIILKADKEFVQDKIKADVECWENQVKNNEISWNKAVIAAASAISKLVIITLATLGSWTAIPALAFNAPICIGVGFLVAVIAVAKIVYNKKHDEELMRQKEKEYVLTPEKAARISPSLLAAV